MVGIGDVHTYRAEGLYERNSFGIISFFFFFTLYCAPMTKDIPQSNSSKGTKWRLMHLYSICVYICTGTTYNNNII